MSQLRPLENEVFKRVVNQLGRRIFVGVDFIYNHLLFAFQFAVGKGRVKDNIGHQLHGLAEIAFEDGRVDRGVLFGGKGIQLATEILEPAVYLPRLTLLGAFEEGVFGEVCQAEFVGRLIARAGSNDQRTMGYGSTLHLTMDAANAVWECIGCELFHVVYSLLRSLR